jgi:hypothetical protein
MGLGIRDLVPEFLDLRSGILDPGSEIQDRRSGIRKKPIPEPGSMGQKVTGSLIRIRSTGFILCRLYRGSYHPEGGRGTRKKIQRRRVIGKFYLLLQNQVLFFLSRYLLSTRIYRTLSTFSTCKTCY